MDAESQHVEVLRRRIEILEYENAQLRAQVQILQETILRMGSIEPGAWRQKPLQPDLLAPHK